MSRSQQQSIQSRALRLMQEIKEWATPENLRKEAGMLIWIVLGNLVYTTGIVLFVLPADLITGGATGIALAANAAFNVPVAIFVACFNGIMFFLGLTVMGWRFAATTVVSTVIYPFLLGLLQNLFTGVVLTDDRLLSAIFGGLLIGIGLALVLRMGASTGGMDIPPLVLNKLFGIPVATMMYVFDFLILLMQAMFSDTHGLLYGILLVMTYTITLDKLLAMGEQHAWLDIASHQAHEIAAVLKETFGSDMLDLYEHHNFQGEPTVGCVVTTRQAHRAAMIALDIDPEAIIVESRATRIRRRAISGAGK